MTLQKTLLRWMLAALAICAGAGVLIVLVPGSHVIGRFCGSGFLTAIAIAFAMAASKMMDAPALRPAGVWALGATVATYLVALLAVWTEILFSSWDFRLAATAFAMFGYGIASTVAVMATGAKAGRAAGRTWFVCLAAVFLLLLIGIWHAASWTGAAEEKCYETAGLLFWMGMLSFIAMIGAGVDAAHWRWIGVAAGAAAFAMGAWGIWNDIHDSSWVLGECVIVAIGVAHANFVLRFHLPPAQRWLPAAAIAAMAASCAGLTYMNFLTTHGFFNRVFEGDAAVSRVTIAFWIAACCGTLAVIILNRYNKRVNPLEAATDAALIKEVALQCPNCRKPQKAPVGSSPCVGCGLILTVRVALPRCVNCDYNTLNLDAQKCPECGAALPPRGVRMETRSGNVPA